MFVVVACDATNKICKILYSIIVVDVVDVATMGSKNSQKYCIETINQEMKEKHHCEICPTQTTQCKVDTIHVYQYSNTPASCLYSTPNMSQ